MGKENPFSLSGAASSAGVNEAVVRAMVKKSLVKPRKSAWGRVTMSPEDLELISRAVEISRDVFGKDLNKGVDWNIIFGMARKELRSLKQEGR